MWFFLILIWNSLISVNLMAASVEEDLPVVVCTGTYDSARNWSFGRTAVVEEWHLHRARDLRDISRQAHAMRPDKHTNFAMFRLQMTLPSGEQVTLFDCSMNTVFASGGDSAFLGSLGTILGGRRVICAADYWHPYPDRAEDSDLRENIAEIMEFREALTGAEKDFIAKALKARISNEDYLGEVILKHTVVSKLVDSCRASLSWNVFDEASNQLAHQLRLIDKTQKAETSWHLNDLFGKSFQLNFADSEQAIRQFICSLDHRKAPPIIVSPFLSFDDRCLHDIAAYKAKWLKIKKEDDELRELAGRLDDHIVDVIVRSGARFSLEIASYCGMCQNCQATFQCEFLNMSIIQQKCMLLMFRGYSMDEDLKWYINGRLYQYGLAKKMQPLVMLTVSSQSAYSTTGDVS